MSFYNRIRKMLNLGDDIDDENAILEDASPIVHPRQPESFATYKRQPDEPESTSKPHPKSEPAPENRQDATAHTPSDTPVVNATDATDATDCDTDRDTACPDEIFATVVELFNSQLPPFINKSLDREAQRRQIYEMLSDSMRQYLDHLADDARRESRRSNEEERARMLAEMDKLRKSNRRAEERGEDTRQQHLSAERQKRALTERVRDLEKQLSDITAEREQFELENKTLVNRVRLLTVQEGDTDALKAENNDLRAQLQRIRAGQMTPEDNEALQQANGQVEQLTARVTELEEAIKESTGHISELEEQQKETAARLEQDARLIDERDTTIAEQRAAIADNEASIAERDATIAERDETIEAHLKTIAALQEEHRTLTTAYDELRSKEEMSDVMLNDLNSKASDAIHQLADARRKLEKYEGTEQRLEQLQQQCDNLLKTNGNLTAEAERGRAALAALADIQSELENLENAKNKREARISQLIEQSDSKDNTIIALQTEVRQLRSALEKHMQHPAADTSRNTPYAADTDAEISVLDDTDWLISTPPSGTDARTQGISDSEFGYQEPPRRRKPDDDPAQMSLF